MKIFKTTEILIFLRDIISFTAFSLINESLRITVSIITRIGRHCSRTTTVVAVIVLSYYSIHFQSNKKKKIIASYLVRRFQTGPLTLD